VQLQSAYGVTRLSGKLGKSSTVAIVDAMDDPNAEADLAVYRSTYGLPKCTTKNGCFREVNQNGVHGGYPAPDEGWPARSRSTSTWSPRCARTATSCSWKRAPALR